MREITKPDGRRWSIVLAGGEGVRMQPAIRRWFGRTTPKQYCRFIGTRSMFQHTLDRTMQFTNPTRTVVVVGRGHQKAWGQIGERDPGMVLVQPGDADTAPGIFFPLTYIRARDLKGTVVISPSDHFIFPEGRFLGEVAYAMRAAEKLATRLLLLAARPTAPETDYGWIQPGDDLTRFGARPVRTVRAFLEKPEPALAELAYRSGALWNTFMMVGNVETIWNLGRRVLPRMMDLFERLGDAIDTPREPELLRTIYAQMPRLNFSRDLLAHAPGDTAVMEMKGVWWSDWGSPDRIVETLTRLSAGSTPPAEHLRAAATGERSGSFLLRDEEDEEQVV